MTTLAETMLNAAELVSNVRRGTATGGSTSTLVDAGMDEQAEYWKDENYTKTQSRYQMLLRFSKYL